MNWKHVASRISIWIVEQVSQAGARGVVVGLSGGVDSAVVLALGQRALGKGVLALIMPCESKAEDTRDALELAESLAVRTVTVPLDGPYHALLNVLPEGGTTAAANLKPRLRMSTLYYTANTMNYLVAGTGNRSELSVGYFTKCGDGGADILPIGGLLKTQVYELAAELGMPPHIIGKTPSAGLLPGQTDEGELGVTYEVLDEIIKAFDAGRKPHAPPAAVAQVRSLMDASLHKRLPAPAWDALDA